MKSAKIASVLVAITAICAVSIVWSKGGFKKNKNSSSSSSEYPNSSVTLFNPESLPKFYDPIINPLTVDGDYTLNIGVILDDKRSILFPHINVKLDMDTNIITCPDGRTTQPSIDESVKQTIDRVCGDSGRLPVVYRSSGIPRFEVIHVNVFASLKIRQNFIVCRYRNRQNEILDLSIDLNGKYMYLNNNRMIRHFYKYTRQDVMTNQSLFCREQLMTLYQTLGDDRQISFIQ
jgi:hypothetical protein